MGSLMYDISDENFKEIVKESYSINEVCRKIGYNNAGGGVWEMFKERCNQLEVDTSHFRYGGFRAVDFFDVFCEDSKVSQDTLKNWFIKGKYVPYECSICGIKEWQGKPITLRLDHINGHKRDNRLDNLRFVCPNCDSQLDTYCGKNKTYTSQANKICIDCGKPCSPGALRCEDCQKKKKRRESKIAPKQEIIDFLIENNGNFDKAGRHFYVTDNSVRKWCRTYGIPSHTKDWTKPKKPRKPLFISVICDETGVEYTSLKDALRAVNNNQTRNKGEYHIKEVCDGKRTTAYGFHWHYSEKYLKKIDEYNSKLEKYNKILQKWEKLQKLHS